MGKKAANLPTGQSQYQVVGRFVPNEKYPEDSAMCKVYRMNLFAKNKVVARSRFWYFMKRLCRVKKANGQIISVSQVSVAATADKPRSSHSDSSAGRQAAESGGGDAALLAARTRQRGGGFGRSACCSMLRTERIVV